MASKRPREVTELDQICEELPSATVRGVVPSLSPVKKARKCRYFEGIVHDGKTSMRMVCFAENLLPKFEKAKEERETLELEDVKLDRSRRGNNFEVVVKSKSQIRASVLKIDASKVEFDGGVVPEVCLEALKEKCVYSYVSVRGKVAQVMKSETLDTGCKQDVIVCDSSAYAKATLWGEWINFVTVGKCYLFANFMVKDFEGKKQLTMRKEGSEVQEIGDIGPAVQITLEEDGGIVEKANVVGVQEFVRKKICRRCKSYVEPGIGSVPVVGRCVRGDCKMVQKYDLCVSRLHATLLFSGDNGEEVSLRANAGQLRDLLKVANDNEVFEEALIGIPTLKSVTYNARNVITEFELEIKQETCV